MPGIRTGDEFIENVNLNEAPLQYYNYTNLVASGDMVLVPSYGIKAMDESAEQVFRDLGYDIIQMKSAANTMCRNGGPKCASETYRRPVYEAPKR